MKKCTSKISCVFLVLAILLVSSLMVSAKGSDKSNISSELITEFIKMEHESDPTCPWTVETKASEVIPTYDFNKNVNGYIVNLTTNGNQTGYMMYDYTTGVPVLAEFGYEGVYTSNGQPLTQKDVSDNAKVIYVQLGTMLIQENESYYTTGDYVDVTNSKASIQATMDAYAEEVGKITGTPQTYEQVIYESVNVANIFTSNYKPVYQGMYTGINKRSEAITCANMLKYWTICRGVPSLYNGYDVDGSGVELTQTVNRLARSMKLVEGAKPDYDNNFNGIDSYCREFKCTLPKGNDNYIFPYMNRDFWDFITRNIKNSNPMAMSIMKEVASEEVLKSDYYLAVGYQRTSTGDFVRIANTLDNSLSHFINFSLQRQDVDHIFYYRWL